MSIWKDKALKTWRYSFQYLRQTYTSSGYETRREASAAREDRRRKLRQENKQRKTTDMAFSLLADQYLTYAERRFVPKTYDYKKFVYQSFIRFHGDPDVLTLTPDEIHQYLDTRPSNYNYNAHRKDLSALFTWGIRQLKLPIQNPCRDIDKMPHTARKKEVPAEEDFLKIILAADPGKDEQDLILTLTHSLARIDEVLRLAWEDANFDTRVLTKWTRKRKGGAYTAIPVPMNQELYDILWRRWQNRKQDKWVFYNEKTSDRYYHRPKLMKGLCKRAGVSQYGFHAIRHFISSYLKNKKKKIATKALKDLLGHTEERTTEIYLHSIDEDLRAATKALEGNFTQKNIKPHSDPHISRGYSI